MEFDMDGYVKGYGNYKATLDGKIIICKTGKEFKPWADGKGVKRGYLKIRLVRDDDNYIIWFLSRFIYTAYLGEIPEGYEIDHIDGNRTNNALSNLRMVTRKQNILLKKMRVPA